MEALSPAAADSPSNSLPPAHSGGTTLYAQLFATAALLFFAAVYIRRERLHPAIPVVFLEEGKDYNKARQDWRTRAADVVNYGLNQVRLHHNKQLFWKREMKEQPADCPNLQTDPQAFPSRQPGRTKDHLAEQIRQRDQERPETELRRLECQCTLGIKRKTRLNVLRLMTRVGVPRPSEGFRGLWSSPRKANLR